jgi:hypothetical protein
LKTLLLIVLCLSLGGLLIGWALGRAGIRWAPWISFAAGSLIRTTGGLLLAASTVVAAAHGGIWYWMLAALLGVLALFYLAFEAFRIWAVSRYGIGGEPSHENGARLDGAEASRAERTSAR